MGTEDLKKRLFVVMRRFVCCQVQEIHLIEVKS